MTCTFFCSKGVVITEIGSKDKKLTLFLMKAAKSACLELYSGVVTSCNNFRVLHVKVSYFYKNIFIIIFLIGLFQFSWKKQADFDPSWLQLLVTLTCYRSAVKLPELSCFVMCNVFDQLMVFACLFGFLMVSIAVSRLLCNVIGWFQ